MKNSCYSLRGRQEREQHPRIIRLMPGKKLTQVLCQGSRGIKSGYMKERTNSSNLMREWMTFDPHYKSCRVCTVSCLSVMGIFLFEGATCVTRANWRLKCVPLSAKQRRRERTAAASHWTLESVSNVQVINSMTLYVIHFPRMYI